MAQVKLDDYVTVAERIEKFYEKYPEGEIHTEDVRIVETNGKSFVMVSACAMTNDEGLRYGQATAWEPIPGRTSFTRDSEVMNAETSAWGRAIAALGFEVKGGIASADEMSGVGATGGKSAAPKPAWVDPLYKKIKSAKDAGLVSVEQVKLQLVACGIEDPKGTKADLAQLPVDRAMALDKWVDSQAKVAA